MTYAAPQRQPGTGPDAFFLTVTWLGSFYLLGPVVMLAMLALAAYRQWRAALLLGIGFYGASLTTWALKLWFAWARPGKSSISRCCVGRAGSWSLG